jgi:AbrB family looped-hinge helix DNA binding protein
MTYATISSKNQITLPAKLLAAMGLKPSDRIEIAQQGGELRLRKIPDFLSLKGSLKGPRVPNERELMMRAVGAHVTGRKA